MNSSPEQALLSKKLATALPETIVFPQKGSVPFYWAQQEREKIPTCTVRPRDIQQLSTAVAIIKHEYDQKEKQATETKTGVFFAIRSGGHSPVPSAASIEGGIVIDLSFFCEVTLSDDRTSVVVGTGARWGDVSTILETAGIAVVGGRNSQVGVGGFLLGGKIPSSILSPFLL